MKIALTISLLILASTANAQITWSTAPADIYPSGICPLYQPKLANDGTLNYTQIIGQIWGGQYGSGSTAASPLAVIYSSISDFYPPATTYYCDDNVTAGSAYPSGATPSIATYNVGTSYNDAGVYVFSEKIGLFYATSAGTIVTTPAQFDSGLNPSVAIDTYAKNPAAVPVVEVHQAVSDSYPAQLWFHVGTMSASGATTAVSWSGSHEVPGAIGSAASVSLAGGDVVLVYEDWAGNLWYDVGQISGSNINWLAKPVQYGAGSAPSVALIPPHYVTEKRGCCNISFLSSTVVETHQSGSSLLYSTGALAVANSLAAPTGIAWTGASNTYYASGCSPSVTLNHSGGLGITWATTCSGLPSAVMYGYALSY